MLRRSLTLRGIGRRQRVYVCVWWRSVVTTPLYCTQSAQAMTRYRRCARALFLSLATTQASVVLRVARVAPALFNKGVETHRLRLGTVYSKIGNYLPKQKSPPFLYWGRDESN